MKQPIETFREAKARHARRRFINHMWEKHQLREEHPAMFDRRLPPGEQASFLL